MASNVRNDTGDFFITQIVSLNNTIVPVISQVHVSEANDEINITVLFPVETVCISFICLFRLFIAFVYVFFCVSEANRSNQYTPKINYYYYYFYFLVLLIRLVVLHMIPFVIYFSLIKIYNFGFTMEVNTFFFSSFVRLIIFLFQLDVHCYLHFI
jgi:hypothetical protein